MKTYFVKPFIATLLLQSSCSASQPNIPPSLVKTEFSGIELSSPWPLKLKGFEYKTYSNSDIKFKTCRDVLDFDYNKIIPFEQFHFKLLSISCNALNKHKDFETSKRSFFKENITPKDFLQLPGLSVPYLSKTEYSHRHNKTIKESFQSINVSADRNGTKILTNDDEFYIHILGRGDFNGDKIEDLLVSSEWYARHARGKHTDLVILSKTGKNEPVNVIWRLNKL